MHEPNKMHRTNGLRQVERDYCGNFEIDRYKLEGLTLFAVRDTKPENNLWSSTCYILKFNGYSIVIDPGFTNIGEIKELKNKLRIQECDVALTHGHYDHTYGIGEMLEEGHIVIHKEDSVYVKGLSTEPEENWNLAHKVAVEKKEPRLKYDFIRNQKVLERILKRIILLHNSEGCTPGKIPIVYWHDAGHTPGHVIYFFQGIAFAGDVLVQGKNRWYIDFLYGKGDKNQRRDVREVRRDCKKSLNMIVNNMHVKYVALGHGGILSIGKFRKAVGSAH